MLEPVVPDERELAEDEDDEDDATLLRRVGVGVAGAPAVASAGVPAVASITDCAAPLFRFDVAVTRGVTVLCGANVARDEREDDELP